VKPVPDPGRGLACRPTGGLEPTVPGRDGFIPGREPGAPGRAPATGGRDPVPLGGRGRRAPGGGGIGRPEIDRGPGGGGIGLPDGLTGRGAPVL
jgi:hypothetical protein